MATITSNNGKLSLTKKNKKENESGIVSNNGKLTITKKQEPKKVEDTIFVSSTPADDAVSGRKFTTTDAAGKYAASHGNNEEVAFRQKMNVDVVGERNKRDDVDEQIDALRDLQKTYKNEMDFWGSSEFKSERYTEAEAKYNELERRIAELDRTAMSQDVIDEAQATQDAVAQYRAQQEEEKRLLNMDLQQAEEQALRLDELRELLPTYENEMDFWPEGSEKHAEAKKAYEKTKAEIAMLEQGYSWDDIDKAAQVQRKAELEQAVNYVGFDNVSKYKPTTTGRGTQNVYVNNWQTYRSTDGWGDLEYELVNKNPDAIEIEEQNRDATGSKTAGADNMYLTFMTDDEVAVYNYYYVTNKALKDEYVQMLKPELLQRQMMGRLASVVEAAETGPVGASLVSVGMTFASLPSYIGQVMDYVDDGRIETNAGYNFAPKAQKAIRDTVGENIEKKLGDKWGKVGSFAYELGMSMADFLAVAGLGAGSVGTVILGGNAAAQTTIEAKERGLSDGQALALGTISGIAEWATERYSVEKLLDMTDLGKSASGYVWKNILAEGGEEGASGLMNLLADVMISKDKSQWRQAVDAYIDRDYDEKSAFAMAVSDQVLALGLDVIGGGLSGGLMAGGGVAGNQIGYNVSRPSGQGVSQRQVMDLIARLAEEEDATQNLESATTEIPVEEIRSQAPETESTEPVAAPPGMAARAGERVVLPGSEPVLEQSGRESGASAQTIQAARRISDAIGREIIFYNAPATRRGTVNGRYENGIIYINAQSKNPLAQIISHELTHSVELAEVYERLAQTVLNRMQQSGADLDALRQNKIELYRDNGVQLQDQKAVDAELVAEYVEKNLLTDEAQILSLVQQDRSLAQRIRDWIDSVLAKLGNEAAQERAFLTNARNLYSQALEQTTVRTQPQMQTEQVQQTQDAATEEQVEARSEVEATLEQLRELLAAGEITEEEFDAIYDAAMQEPEMQDGMFSISEPAEKDAMLNNLRKYLDGGMSLQELNRRIGARGATRSQTREDSALSEDAQKIKNAARRQRMSVQEYLHQNWELFDVDGEWNQAAREALDNERGSRYSISEGKSQLDPAVLAKELAEAGASAREIFGSTGLIVLPNGTITNPETGAIVGRYEYGQDTEANDERGVQGVRDGDVPRGREENRRNVGTGSGKTTNELGKSWEQLGGDKTRKIEQAVNSHMENAPYEGAVLYKNMGAEAFSRRFYEMMLQGRPIAELWKNQIPDIQGLMEEIEGITSEDEAQYSIEDEQENLLIDDEREMAMDALLRDVEREQEEQFYEVDRNTQNTKARAYLQSAERAMERGLGRAMDVPTLVQRTDLREIVQSITDEYLKTGTVQDETVRSLFEEAYANGIKVDDEFYNENKDIKDYLRTTAVTISDADKAAFADWGEFTRYARGILRLRNEGGLPVDTAYQELRAMAPGLFPEIYAPADQLQRMRDVAGSIRKVEKTLDEYYGADAAEFKRWALNDFETAINEHLSELEQVRRYAEERAAKRAEVTVPQTVEEVMQLYTEMKDLRRNRDKVRAKNLLTDNDAMLLGRLHKGEIRLEDLPEGSNVKGIANVYEAEREYEQKARVIREYNRQRKEGLRQEADSYLQTANEWRDKKTGLQYARETQERNIRDIVPDAELAQRIIDRYFAPVHEAQAASTKLKNEMRRKVKDMGLSRKVEKGNSVSEAHAVQLLGEAEDNIRVLENSRGRMKARDGKTLADWRAIVENLWKENPNLNEQKIRKAVNDFRGIYDTLFQRMNEARVRNGYEPINYRQGYFPHFQPGDTDGILGAFAKAAGIDMQTMALPTSINGLTHTFKPGIQWFGNAQERLGFNTAYDAVEGFDRYIEGVADVIFQTDNLQRLRALAAQIRYRTTDEGIRKQVDQVMENPDLSEEDKKNRIEKIYENGKYTLSNFVVDLEEYTNLLANKKSRADRNMEQALGRGMYQLIKTLESRVAANMVAVNPGSWLTNFIPLTQGGAQLGRGNLLQGMWQTLKNYKVHDGFEGRSSFLTNRRGSDPLVRTWAENASDFASRPMEVIDTFVADSLVRARTLQNMKQGLSEDAAIREADAWASGVMADRSKGSLPTLFSRSNPITKVFTQFQLEVNNQFSYLFKDLPRDQKKKGILALTTALLKFFLGAWLYNEIYEYFIGRRPALDPIGMLNTAVGDFTGYQLPNLVELGQDLIAGEDPDFTTEKQDRYTAAYNLFISSAEELPFIGGILGGGRVPIQSALPDFQNLGKVVFSENWSPEKKLATAGKELLNPLVYLATPFGGGQIKKALQGIKATIEGGRYTVDAEGNRKLQYPVYGNEAVTAAVFGPTATTTGREWIENDFPTLGIHETAAYDALREELGMDEREAYEAVQAVRAAEKTGELSEAKMERQVLRDLQIDDKAKGMIYYAMLASEKEIELMDLLTENNEDLGSVYQMLDTVKDAENSNVKRQAILDANLTEDEKIAAYRYLMGTKQEDGSYISSRDDDIEAFRAAGLSFDQFLQAQNEYTEINDAYSGAGTKAVEFSRWVDQQRMTMAQEDVVKEAFSYYSNVPASAGNYDKFTGAGLSEDAAYQLNNALGDLEPENGAASVSARQKYKAVADRDLSDEETLKAFEVLMGESEYKKVVAAESLAVSPKLYANVKYTLPEFDENENGSYSNAEIEAAIDAYAESNRLLRLDNGDMAILWQALTGSTSAKNNPYSRSVGQDYLDRLQEE